MRLRSHGPNSCDDLAKQLASQISDLKVGATRGGVIYLVHPTVKQAWLGCSGRNIKNEISATATTRKPSKEFLDFISTAAALVFTIPKGDALAGAQRCIGRIGIFRGYNISTRYRKLDIRCARPKDATEITISRRRMCAGSYHLSMEDDLITRTREVKAAVPVMTSTSYLKVMLSY